MSRSVPQLEPKALPIYLLLDALKDTRNVLRASQNTFHAALYRACVERVSRLSILSSFDPAV